MTANQHSRAVTHLAREAGVLTDWIDAWGNEQQVARDDLLGVLSALTGRRLDTERAVTDTLGDFNADRSPVDAVLVAWNGVMPSVPIDLEVRNAVIVLEDGGEIPIAVDGSDLTTETPLPTGYHGLVINGGAHTSHIFSAPTLAHPAPRNALGLIAPTYSLRRSEIDTGLGSIGDLTMLAELCHEVGVDVVGTLPLLAAFDDQPSPYAPVSRRAWNELFVDFGAIPDWAGSGPVTSEHLRWVDYDATGKAIRSDLFRYSAHVTATPRLRAQVEAFLKREPEMRRYAEFRAFGDVHGRNWRLWGSSVVPDRDRLAYHETVQWLMDKQLAHLSGELRDRGQHLYLDLPIGCHSDGYDVWDDPELFAPASLGAPPDTLFFGGQDWGLPASIPRLARKDGHRNFRKAIQRQLSVAGLLRIDHVMGTHRAWWVPHGAEATEGAYVMQAAEEMFAIICIESVRANAGIVGENLGTVPPEIRDGLSRHGLLGITMVHDGATEPNPTDLVALSSHDTPAFAAWWKALDVDDLEDLGVFDDQRASFERARRTHDIGWLRQRFGTDSPEDTRDALMTWMAESDAAVALINLDDMLMEERRQNIPGTHLERPNWRLRYDRTLDDMSSDVTFTDRLRGLSETRREDARSEDTKMGCLATRR
jgi:4-alpha-glucanotransferase